MQRQSRSACIRALASGAVAFSSLLVVLFAPAASAQYTQYQRPFQPVETATFAPLQRRQECIANFYSCAAQSGAAWNGICCANGQICSVDAATQPACCPVGAVCTGTAPANFVPPATTAPVSFVPNTYFAFPYITTSFANAAACNAAVDQCNRNYDTCQSQLQGGLVAGGAVYGVTIVVPGGGGTTVAATGQSLGATAAASVCASLSRTACFGIQPTVCSSQGYVNGVFYVGSANPAAARPTPPPAAALPLAAAALGVGLGVVGAL